MTTESERFIAGIIFLVVINVGQRPPADKKQFNNPGNGVFYKSHPGGFLMSPENRHLGNAIAKFSSQIQKFHIKTRIDRSTNDGPRMMNRIHNGKYLFSCGFGKGFESALGIPVGKTENNGAHDYHPVGQNHPMQRSSFAAGTGTDDDVES